jgi:lysozyme family protein
MSHRASKIDKLSDSAPIQEKTRTSGTKKSKISFDDAFNAAFKQVSATQSSFPRMEDMQINFKKNLFNPAIPMPAPNFSPPAFQPSGGPAGSDFKSIMKVVMKHEGTAYVRKDGGKGSSRMGILQSTAKQYGYTGDIKHITKAQAETIYKKIWDKSGAANLPYPLSVIHFDTYVNSPAAARKILKQSGGNVDTYLQMREQRYVKLASVRPQMYSKYLKGWINRVNDLKVVAAEYARSQQPEQVKTASSKTTRTTT